LSGIALEKGGEVKRIQRKRTKGRKMPANTIYVGRPTKWGNPYPVSQYGLKRSLELYRAWLEGNLLREPRFLEPLRGKDLACWCPLDKPCHADVLLEFLKGGDEIQ
jgi:hypothetical protein